jgi:hypothetical protein
MFHATIAPGWTGIGCHGFFWDVFGQFKQTRERVDVSNAQVQLENQYIQQ